MDAIASEAIASLTTALTSLLPPPVDPALPHSVLVTPTRITPTGLGGFTGVHPDPEGEVFGRRVAARITVSVGAQNTMGLDPAVARVTEAVMTASRGELSQLGILKLGVLELGARPAQTQPPSPQRRDVEFDVLFEFLKLPQQAGGIIQTIPLDIESTLSANDPQVVMRGAFLPNALDVFEVIDDGAANTAAPSAWSFNAGDPSIVQTSDINGGTDAATANKPGTYLVLRANALRPAVKDFTMAAELLSTSQGGVGFVFRFIDADNFYFALLDSRTGFRLFGKKVGGAFGALQQGGVDATAGFSVGALMRVRLAAQGDEFRLLIDGEEVLRGKDGDIPDAGRVGFMTRHCTGARFFDLMLVRF